MIGTKSGVRVLALRCTGRRRMPIQRLWVKMIKLSEQASLTIKTSRRTRVTSKQKKMKTATLAFKAMFRVTRVQVLVMIPSISITSKKI